MSFLQDAQIIIPEITGVDVTFFSQNPYTYEEFEQKYCFSAAYQPLYTQHGLRSFFDEKDIKHIYFVTDALKTCVFLFNAGNQWVLFGPYVTTLWEKNAARIVLAKCGAKDELYLQYQKYFCSLPLIKQEEAQNIAYLFMNHANTTLSPTPAFIDLGIKKIDDITEPFSPYTNNELLVKQNYDWEAQIMDAVRHGDSTHALQLLEKMERPALHGIRFLTNSMVDKIAASFAVRVLVRHAAIQAGLAPIYVDALSQEYAQKMHQAHNESQLLSLMRQYILTFCHAVQENLQDHYSPYVKRAIQYIELKLSQPIDVEELSQLNHITKQYFSTIFKKETGKTVKEYIMHIRCHRASELLENSSLPIQEISRYVGYDDTNYFSRVFKKVMGQTPQEYRRGKTFF